MTTATTTTVEQKIIETIVSFGAPAEKVTREATWEELDIDSLDLVELAEVAEEEFGAVLKPDDLKAIETVGQAIDAVAAKAT